MDVNGASSLSGARSVGSVRPHQQPAPAQPTPPTTPADEVEISAAGQMLDKVTESSEFRAERLAQIKAAIEDGTYETLDKLDVAVDRLLDDIQPDPNSK